MKSLRLFLLGLLFPLFTPAQSAAGCWYGTAFVPGLQESQHNYLIELILIEKGPKVEGIMNYYFRNVYRSVPITGSMKQQQLLLTKIPFLYYGSVIRKEVDCFMDGAFTLVMARVGSTISGKLIPDVGYKYTCPPLQLRLNLDKEQKITDSLRQVIKSATDQTLAWSTPLYKNEVTSAEQTKESTRIAEQKNMKPQSRISPTNEPAVVKMTSTSAIPRPGILELVQEMELDIDQVLVRLYDNGEVDGDSVSIYMNNKPIKVHQRLTNQPIEFSIPLDSLLEYVEIIMVAENLGTIPPNTALMIVEAGMRRYELRLTSTLEKSATVRFKRKRKGLKFRPSDLK